MRLVVYSSHTAVGVSCVGTSQVGMALCPLRHGQEGQSYQHVIQVCRLVWNMSCKTVATARGRVSLVPLLFELLDILSLLSSRRRKSVMRFIDLIDPADTPNIDTMHLPYPLR